MTTAPSDRRPDHRTAIAAPTDDELTAHLREQRVTAQRALRAVLGISAEEEDLIQEVMTRLVIRLRQPGEITVGAWTWTVAHNVAVDHLRARRATPTDVTMLDRGVGDGLDSHAIGAELATAVTKSLARLPERQRSALVAHAQLDGGRGGHALVAANLGVSPKAAESILARARHSMRRELDRFGLSDGPWVAAGVAVAKVRRLFRPNPAAMGIAAISMVTVITASGLVVLGPTPRRGPMPPTPGLVLLTQAGQPTTPAEPTPPPSRAAPRPHHARPPPVGRPRPARSRPKNSPERFRCRPRPRCSPCPRPPPTASRPARSPSRQSPSPQSPSPAGITIPSVPPVTVPGVTLPASSITVPNQVTIPSVSSITVPDVTVPVTTIPVPLLPPAQRTIVR